MKSLREYLKQEPFNDMIKYVYHINNVNEWLFETYDETSNQSEESFYIKKYDNVYYNTPQYWFWRDYLYETLSHSLKTIDSRFIKLLNNIDGLHVNKESSNEYLLSVNYDNNFDKYSENFKTLLNFCNYFISSKLINDKLPNPFIIEARRPETIIYNPNEQKYAYHVTSKWNYEKIKKCGLIPKSKSTLTNYDLRIYLWFANDIDNIKYFINTYGRFMLRLEQIDKIKDNKKHNLHNNINVMNDYVVLRINLQKFNDDNNDPLMLFHDPQNTTKTAVFTMEPIRTKYIEKIDL